MNHIRRIRRSLSSLPRRAGLLIASAAPALLNAGRGRVEDLPGMARKHPLMNDYWRSKITDIQAITAPAYVVASWTNPVHTRGTLEAFTKLEPSRSWLRVHNTQEWPDQYAHEADLLAFFDHVVKGKDNGWQQAPRVNAEWTNKAARRGSRAYSATVSSIATRSVPPRGGGSGTC